MSKTGRGLFYCKEEERCLIDIIMTELPFTDTGWELVLGIHDEHWLDQNRTLSLIRRKFKILHQNRADT
eukprot:12200702-Ditylum_brightwellii.AAC.1